MRAVAVLAGLAVIAGAAGDAEARARKKKKAKKQKAPVAAPAPAPEPVPAPAPEPAPAPVRVPMPFTDPGPPGPNLEPVLLSEVRYPDRPARRAAPPRIRVAVAGQPFWRRLRYNDDLRDVTRSYDLAANAIGVELAVRPLSGQPGLSLFATGLLAVGVNGSRTSDGTEYATGASEWSAGAGYAGQLGAVQLGARAGYGEHRVRIADDPAPGAELIPDVAYRFARAGLDARAALAPRWHLVAAAGGRYLLATGDLTGADWFPRATGHGVDGALGAGYALARRVSLHARAEVRHYFFAMNPEPGDPMIVGGATDTYLGASVGAAVELW